MAAKMRTVDDAGARVGDRAERRLDEAALIAMSPAEAEAQVCKDAVWPPPDWRALVAAGVDPRAAALVKIIRDRIPSRPAASVQQRGTHYAQRRLRDTSLVQRDYVKMLGHVRDALSACATPDDVRAARVAVTAAVGWTPRGGAETEHLVLSVWRGPVDTLQIDYRDTMKAEAMIRDGWPGGPAPTWRRGYNVMPVGDGTFMVVKGVSIQEDGFSGEDEAWEWLRRTAQAAREGSSPTPLPVRPTVPIPMRDGLPKRRSDDVTATHVLDIFGLRAVEFGKWVPQTERQSLLNRTHDALHDLADVLGLEPTDLGLGGSLSLSFGARSSGSAAADYAADLRVIALPRAFGSGELAHCWGHAFDHWAGEYGQSRSASPRMASGWACGIVRPTQDVKHLPAAAGAAWLRLNGAMWARNPGADDEARRLGEEIAQREAEAAEVWRQRTGYINRNPNAAETTEGAAYLAKVDGWLATRNEHVLPDLRRRLGDIQARVVTDEESSFAGEARRLCGRDGNFWARPHEMFARAFESFVADRLAGRGARNDFLVHGVEPGRFAQGVRGNPYPVGDERARIAEATAGLIATSRPSLQAAAREAMQAAREAADAQVPDSVADHDHIVPQEPPSFS